MGFPEIGFFRDITFSTCLCGYAPESNQQSATSDSRALFFISSDSNLPDEPKVFCVSFFQDDAVFRVTHSELLQSVIAVRSNAAHGVAQRPFGKKPRFDG